MQKKITSIIIALIFSLSITGVSLAAKCKGTVESVDNGKIVIVIDGKCKFKPGDKITIKTKKVIMEGC